MGAKNMIRTTASVAGVPLGEFRTFSGGAFDMGERKSRNGAGQAAIARKGLRTTENVTISREDDGALIDGQPQIEWAKAQRGKTMTVTRQPLDDDGNPRGKPTVYTGVLKRVGPGEGDVSDDSDDDVFELEQLTDDV